MTSTQWTRQANANTSPAYPVSDRGDGTFTNPVAFADIPDVDIATDGTHYYMVSTTMFYAPSVPIMRSTDLVNWTIAGYTAPILDDTAPLALRAGENAYGRGSWAASIIFRDGTFYISVASQTTDETYVYTTRSIENGPWTRSVLDGYNHDQSLMFDGDARCMFYGAGSIRMRPLAVHRDGTVSYAGGEVRLVDDASIDGTGLPAEGAHAYRIGDHYYVFMIEWPSGGIRRELVWRSRTLTPQSAGGVWEGRVVFSEGAVVEGRRGGGVAQGGVVQTPSGHWYSMMFQDQGPVGRAPQLAKVTWSDDGWPHFALTTTIPGTSSASRTDIVISDEFDNSPVQPGYWNSTNAQSLASAPENAPNGSNLALQWQWNHNPDNRYWSLTDHPGHLRLTTGALATGLLDARNTLTQRAFGPSSSGAVSLDVSHMKDGDNAGIAALQQQFGTVGVTMADGVKHIVMQGAVATGSVTYTSAPVPVTVDSVFLKLDFDFRGFADTATFFYSFDGTGWTPIGQTLRLTYSLTMFTGYRFALYNYATATTGGYVDIDWFRVSDRIS